MFSFGSSMPKVRGTAEPYGGAYLPTGRRSRIPSRHSSLPHCGRTDGEGQDYMSECGHRLRTTFSAV